jgi:tetratricopeptide (TPR) repeat protein
MLVDEIYGKFYNNNLTINAKDFIELYEQNYVLLNLQNSVLNIHLRDKKTRILADYSLSLVERKSYLKALPYLNDAIDQFKNMEDFKYKDPLDIQYIETLVFNKAVANFYSKKFNKAISDLNRLIKKFPDNDSYKNWLVASKNYNRREISNLFFYVMLANLIFTSFISEEDIGFFYDILLVLEALCLFIVLYYEYTIRRTNRKIIKSKT